MSLLAVSDLALTIHGVPILRDVDLPEDYRRLTGESP